ncbi:Eco29kI family restriction endonuclease [Streptomyces niveus]|uniref:Eco29kI family restriction endonuclease n=1 Tax=Streptomyces niveus TaxID=193462 RepID=UPI00364E4A8C
MAPTGPYSDEAKYHKDFKLNITKALGDQLAEELQTLAHAPLTEESISSLTLAGGVYQLYHQGEFVYVGKADSSLPDRLRHHLRKIAGRRNIPLSDLTFSCLYVDDDFSALAPEQLLIYHHKRRNGIPWNNNGFGNKDPGRQRDTSLVKVGHFDMRFPIDLDFAVTGLAPGVASLDRLLKTAKERLPYVFRYQSLPRFKQAIVEIPSPTMTADSLFRLISTAIPGDWQIVALMGYVIMYPDSPQTYASASRYYRAGGSSEARPQVDLVHPVEEDVLPLGSDDDE